LKHNINHHALKTNSDEQANGISGRSQLKVDSTHLRTPKTAKKLKI